MYGSSLHPLGKQRLSKTEALTCERQLRCHELGLLGGASDLRLFAQMGAGVGLFGRLYSHR